MLKLDLWILDNIFQKISNMVWRIIPISCFVLAKICLLFCCSFSSMMYIEHKNPFLIVFMIASFSALYFTIFMAEKITKPKFLNPHRYLFRYIRLLTLFIIVVQSYTFDFITISSYFFSFTYYFLSCTPLPPQERRSFVPRFSYGV